MTTRYCQNDVVKHPATMLVITGCINQHLNEHYLCDRHFGFMRVAWHCKTCQELTTDYISIHLRMGTVRSSWYGSEYTANYQREAPKWP